MKEVELDRTRDWTSNMPVRFSINCTSGIHIPPRGYGDTWLSASFEEYTCYTKIPPNQSTGRKYSKNSISEEEEMQMPDSTVMRSWPPSHETGVEHS